MVRRQRPDAPWLDPRDFTSPCWPEGRLSDVIFSMSIHIHSHGGFHSHRGSPTNSMDGLFWWEHPFVNGCLGDPHDLGKPLGHGAAVCWWFSPPWPSWLNPQPVSTGKSFSMSSWAPIFHGKHHIEIPIRNQKSRSGWWFGTWLLPFNVFGMSSQLTNSYFSSQLLVNLHFPMVFRFSYDFPMVFPMDPMNLRGEDLDAQPLRESHAVGDACGRRTPFGRGDVTSDVWVRRIITIWI